MGTLMNNTWSKLSAVLVITLALGCTKKDEASTQGEAVYPDTSQTDTPATAGDTIANDSATLDDAGFEDTGFEDIAVDDGNGPDTDMPADAEGDTPDFGKPPQPDTGGPDEEGPQVVSAFSSDGLTVSVRFTEDIDSATGSDSSNFTIKGSDNSTIGVSAAVVEGRFARLTLTNPNDVNSDLTYTCFVKNVEDISGNSLDTSKSSSLIRRTVYLNIIWHQHQPLYYEAARDELSGPWVRKHATKDYYDMAAILAEYPEVHLNINLTLVLLDQLELYNERLLPFVDKTTNTVDSEAFLAKWKGKTDPFIDLLLEPTPTPEAATEKQIGLLYDDPWATVSTSDATMVRWPEYVALREKNPKLLTQTDFLMLKILFELAWFDPDFIKGPVKLPTGSTVDLTDLVTAHADGTFTLAKPASEAMANRLVAENAKIIEAVIPIHKELMYNYQTKKGQIEITMTPFYHPILPLIYNTNLASSGQPFDPLPNPAFSFPLDAEAQVQKAVAAYEGYFGIPPQGVWCGEGSVAEEIVGALRNSGLRWTATDRQVLESSTPSGQKHWFPFRVDEDTVIGDGGSHDDEMLIVFRDTQMSNDIGFKYQSFWGQDATDDLLASVLAQAPPFGAKDRLVTLIVDGENAWEEYRFEHDGKGFHHALYGSLSESTKMGEIVTVTVSEYIDGNPERAVPPHPIKDQTELEPLWRGSWIDGTYAIWIGEGEENVAWGYLLAARSDLEKSGLPRPNPLAPAPADADSKAALIWNAWESIYAAEGSDWFWWYGKDMTTPANDDTPFDKGFRGHLTSMYTFMNAVLEIEGKPTFTVPDFPPIIQAQPQPPAGPFTPGSEPIIDGLLTPNEIEWTDEGGFFYDNDSGAQANQDDDISLAYYGYTDTALMLGILANDDLSAKLGGDYDVFVYASHKHIIDAELGTFTEDPANPTSRYGTELTFNAKGAAREIRVNFGGATPQVSMSTADGNGNWLSASHQVAIGGPTNQGKLIEMNIPWADLNVTPGDPLSIYIVASAGGNDVDIAPSLGAKVIFDDSTNAVFVTFRLDASGSEVAVDTYGQINTPPPPAGNGIVYISGNHDKLLQWTPNKLALLDDGVAPDEVAGDGIWAATFALPPGTLLRYKYTIGLPKDEANWWGTEEFPLTERGLDITKDPTKKKMVVHDIFADRPAPSGTAGKKTVIECLGDDNVAGPCP
ncbi:MAG: alpha-amylase/alpha-mannosidase (GH57 family) [Myxococcota bacterium]|jgi:alpha-amylase/alpha-mannosidase (GH57 family)